MVSGMRSSEAQISGSAPATSVHEPSHRILIAGCRCSCSLLQCPASWCVITLIKKERNTSGCETRLWDRTRLLIPRALFLLSHSHRTKTAILKRHCYNIRYIIDVYELVNKQRYSSVINNHLCSLSITRYYTVAAQPQCPPSKSVWISSYYRHDNLQGWRGTLNHVVKQDDREQICRPHAGDVITLGRRIPRGSLADFGALFVL